jgi:probable F420-dependent oxidoreductase
VKFGLQIYPWHRWPDLRAIADIASLAEQCGFDAVALPDHVVAPAGPGQSPLGPVWPDVYLVAANIAARTTEIRLLLYATVIPYRPVIQQAKAIATLDQLSAGRLVVVAGTGWCTDEFDRLGICFADRGAITDDYIRAMIALWTEDFPSFAGEHANFGPVHFAPRCVQIPHVPIWIAGSGKRPLRRLISYGTGWAPMSGDLFELARNISAAKEAMRAAGRETSDVEFSFGLSYGYADEAIGLARNHVDGVHGSAAYASAEKTRELVAAHQQAGFTQLIVSTAWETPADLSRRIEWFAENVIRELPDEHTHAAFTGYPADSPAAKADSVSDISTKPHRRQT